MIECKRILAVVDAERDNQPALSRAYELASKTGASVTAIMVVYDLSYDMTTMLSPDEREAMRDAVTNEHAKWLSGQLKEQGFDETDIVVEWNNRAYESIIYYTLKNQIDLVVKATKKHDDLASIGARGVESVLESTGSGAAICRPVLSEWSGHPRPAGESTPACQSTFHPRGTDLDTARGESHSRGELGSSGRHGGGPAARAGCHLSVERRAGRARWLGG